MKNSFRTTALLLQLLFINLCYANDGAFRAAGNQLILVQERSNASTRNCKLNPERTNLDKKMVAWLGKYLTKSEGKVDEELLPQPPFRLHAEIISPALVASLCQVR